MTNHRIHYAGLDPSLQARCSCKKKSPIGNRSEVDDWYAAHLQEVERIRTHLASRTISLPRQHAWFLERAEDPDVDPEDRTLWAQLAAETGAYIARKSDLLEQDPLF
jgi:hypothetical protein